MRKQYFLHIGITEALLRNPEPDIQVRNEK